MKIVDNIYALIRRDTNQIFYVGRTNNPYRRYMEHVYSAERGHEDKYRYIREHLQDVEWDLEVLREIYEGEVVDDYEDFYVIKAIRAGHPLKNMKAGDARQAVAREAADSSCVFNSVEDVAAWKRARAVVEEVDSNAHPQHVRAREILKNIIAKGAQHAEEARLKKERLEVQRAKREAEVQAAIAARRNMKWDG